MGVVIPFRSRQFQVGLKPAYVFRLDVQDFSIRNMFLIFSHDCLCISAGLLYIPPYP